MCPGTGRACLGKGTFSPVPQRQSTLTRCVSWGWPAQMVGLCLTGTKMLYGPLDLKPTASWLWGRGVREMGPRPVLAGLARGDL